MGSSTGLSLLCFCLVLTCLLTTISGQDPYFQARCRNNSGYYTADSAYKANLDRIFGLMENPTTPFNYGFFNLSGGLGEERVNSIALCREDINQDACINCLNQTISQLQQECPREKEAVGWSEFCLLRYSTRNIYRTVEVSPNSCLLNTQNATDIKYEFSWVLSTLLDKLRDEAAAGGFLRKYAANNSSLQEGFTVIYGQVQCTPDLSQDECSTCLDKARDATGSCCESKIGCRILLPSCVLRYESEPFYRNPFDSEQPLPPPQPPSPPTTTSVSGRSSSDSTRRIITIIVPSAVGILALNLGACLLLRRKNPWHRIQNPSTDQIIKDECLQFDFATIAEATDNFSEANKLGQGGFGAVYKGQLPNGDDIAVKRLSMNSNQGEVEFKNEVLLMARLQHRNLVKLLGFCSTGNERLLIYEFVPNASLDKFIFDPMKRELLGWDVRHKIIVGVARGILYLHEDSRLRIIHRDLKASNVLLDADMNPRIADFGMARLSVRDETQGNTSRIVGTYGYMAPEYALHGQFSVKSDVFSFGMLVLEIICGGRNTSLIHNGENFEYFLTYVWKNWIEGRASTLIDPSVKDGSRSEMIRCIHIGLLCVQENAMERPNMASVILMLNTNSTTLPLPLQPAFFMHNNIGIGLDITSSSQGRSNSSTASSSTHSRSKSFPFSRNSASISELLPR